VVSPVSPLPAFSTPFDLRRIVHPMRKNAGQIIRRYAAALFESASEGGSVESVAITAHALERALTPESLGFFVNPGVSAAAKEETLAEVLKASQAPEVLRTFLSLLIVNKRFAVAPDILREFLRLSDVKLGIARVELITARPLDDGQEAEFEKALGSALRKKVVITKKVDADLKAGYVVKIGNTLVDASLKSRLQNLKESLTQGV
jgi:F-type H+-transporting ATPase subunit delta